MALIVHCCTVYRNEGEHVIGNCSGTCIIKFCSRSNGERSWQTLGQTILVRVNAKWLWTDHQGIPRSVFPSKPCVLFAFYSCFSYQILSKEKAPSRSTCIPYYVGQLPLSKGQERWCIFRASLEENQRAPLHPVDWLCVFNVLWSNALQGERKKKKCTSNTVNQVYPL